MADYGLVHGDFSPDGAGEFYPGRGDNRNTGRVPGVGQGTGPPSPFQLFSDATVGGAAPPGNAAASGFMSDTMQHVWHAGESGGATGLFMSKANVDALQDAIRYRVYVETHGRHVIGRQSDVELALVMRSVLLQRGRNDDGSDVLEQVRQLNAEVLEWCVPRIASEVEQWLRYRDDIATLPTPMAYGQVASMKGTRELQLKSFF